jgi:hypothetical protein
MITKLDPADVFGTIILFMAWVLFVALMIYLWRTRGR